MSIAKKEEIDHLRLKISVLENKLNNIDSEIKKTLQSEIAASSVKIDQSQMLYGMYTALCIDTIDIWKQNRIRWYSPIFHDPTLTVSQLPWAHVISSLGGFDDSGLSWVPPAGSTVCLIFENGNLGSPFYIGTTWHRNRGPEGQRNFGFNIKEFYDVWEGNRDGYLVGPNDGSQVFPPWNTENYNGFDLSSEVDFDNNPQAQKLITYPNIHGLKTPEKHYIKMVDGDPRCNRKWKRFEIMSSRGNWIMMKDDHLHYAGQWANPQCGGKLREGEVSCVEGASANSQIDTLAGGFNSTGINSNANNTNSTPGVGNKTEDTECDGTTSNSKIIGGHPSTGGKTTKYYESQVGTNPFFKHKQECRPYSGAPTPQNNSCDLPQTGIQIMSISGHTFVMDDSVEEPSGDPTWDQEFNFGCNNHYVGHTYWKSATGHLIEMSDVEGPQGDDGSNLRGEDNYIRILTATGNKIELNDHTQSQAGCPGCPPNIAGSRRGIHLQSTSNHTFDMVDEENAQCSGCRMEGGIPVAKAKKAFVKIRTGYGLQMSFNDDFSQEETQQQNIQIYCPQKDNTTRGPHIHRFQESPSGPGLVLLRVGGNYIVSTNDDHITMVGDEVSYPSNLIEVVSKNNIVSTKKEYINTAQRHFFIAKEQIFLLAGQDCNPPPADCSGYGGTDPCFGAVIVYDYCTGTVRISDRVFASTSANASQLSMFNLLPFAKSQGTGLSNL
jgi:hypothetical protein